MAPTAAPPCPKSSAEALTAGPPGYATRGTPRPMKSPESEFTLSDVTVAPAASPSSTERAAMTATSSKRMRTEYPANAGPNYASPRQACKRRQISRSVRRSGVLQLRCGQCRGPEFLWELRSCPVGHLLDLRRREPSGASLLRSMRVGAERRLGGLAGAAGAGRRAATGHRSLRGPGRVHGGVRGPRRGGHARAAVAVLRARQHPDRPLRRDGGEVHRRRGD